MTLEFRTYCPACRVFIGEVCIPDWSFYSPSFCSDNCPKRPVPGVYRYICPDGRCYVGSVDDIRKRNQRGLSRSNPWLFEAFKKYPPETWTYEVLEKLPQGSPVDKRRHAEQRFIERFRSWNPKHGFNIYPAVWKGRTRGILAARARYAEQVRHRRLEECAA